MRGIKAFGLALVAMAGLAGCDETPTGRGPAVLSVAVPNPGLYKTGDVLTLRVEFAAPVKVQGAPAITLAVGGQTRSFVAISGASGKIIPFSYTVAQDDNDGDGLAYAADQIVLDKDRLIRDGANRAVQAKLPPVDMAGVRVNNDSSAPKILRITGPDQTYGMGQEVNLMVQFDEMIEVKGGRPSLHVLIGGIEREAAMLPNPPGSSNLVFQLKPEQGDYALAAIKPLPPIDAGGGQITDSNGNPADLSFASSQILLLTKVDARLPRLKSVATTPGLYRKGDKITITLAFDKRMTAWRRYDQDSRESSRGDAGGREPMVPQYARPRAGMPPMELSAAVAPRLQLDIDGAKGEALLDQSTNGSENLVFTYTVRGRDEDLDGVVIKAALDPAGSMIMDDGGNLFSGTLADKDIRTELRLRNPVRFTCPVGSVSLPGRNGCLLSEPGETSLTVPDDVTSITVRAWGAGGGGGAKNGLGGAGGYAEADIKVQPLSVLRINVPSGGGRGLNADQPSGGGGGGYAAVADSTGKPILIAGGGGGAGGALYAPDQGAGGAGGGKAGSDGQNGIGDNSCTGGTGGGPELAGLGGSQGTRISRDGASSRGGAGDPLVDNGGGKTGGPGGASAFGGGGGGGGWRGGGGGCQSATLYSHGAGGGGGSSWVDGQAVSRALVDSGRGAQPPRTVKPDGGRDGDYLPGRSYGGHPDNNYVGGSGLVVVRFN